VKVETPLTLSRMHGPSRCQAVSVATLPVQTDSPVRVVSAAVPHPAHAMKEASRMPQNTTHRAPFHRRKHRYSDIVIGMSDGLTVPFALASRSVRRGTRALASWSPAALRRLPARRRSHGTRWISSGPQRRRRTKCQPRGARARRARNALRCLRRGGGGWHRIFKIVYGPWPRRESAPW